MRIPYRKIVRTGAGLLLTALVVAFVGLLPTRASSGHWAVTQWFLSFFKARSVGLYALFVPTPPPLDDPRRVVRGAGYYETGCLSCHGAPGQEASIVARSMTPEPPLLAPRVDRWSPRELFHITRHGIKFTGMPAWPALAREDEVWDMVAFMRLLPALDSAEYRRLAWGTPADAALADVEQASPTAGVTDPGDPAGAVAEAPAPTRVGPGAEASNGTPTDVPAAVLADCARCHGPDGGGRLQAFPRLAGQKRAYLAAALEAFAERRRASGVMQPIAAALPRKVREALATHYAGLPPEGSDGAASEGATARARATDPAPAVGTDTADEGGAGGDLARGAAIATGGVPERRIPACIQCHGPMAGPRNPHFPHLSGQPRAYLERQLRLFRDGHRGGSLYAPIMQEIGPRLNDRQISDVAAWYASLPPAGP